ncbi:phosphatidylcholine/phosphatidylserine synthase [Salinisphaera sp. USBA-960]|uniref:CDP-alcohol phosphatidyltransferase family protein n=1 Tax=Salinisphaera orenii TaxID=856731 RepID=UPI000DBE70C0|nr:phosphatidylcholine/phosphatidylserine synthase [Salifodinibacter halophilus]NNC25472.1 phosphatidylcholine/phosphatidylserine synthase [Salifodinibacter halophilus]
MHDHDPDAPTQRRRRGIYLLPNLFTTGTLFAGFYAIIAATQDYFTVASIAIFVAMLTDMLDGRVARWTRAETDFGIQFDSLADLVAFGMASSLVAFMFSLDALAQTSDVAGKLGWLAAFFYIASAALRLARFNIARGAPTEKNHFVGLPSPAAAGVLVGFVWVMTRMGVSGDQVVVPVFGLTVATGALMVSNVRYRSFKKLSTRRRVPFHYVLAMVGVFVLIVLFPPFVLFAAFFGFALSGPVEAILRRRHIRRN